jgi:hypothetical protein
MGYLSGVVASAFLTVTASLATGFSQPKSRGTPLEGTSVYSSPRAVVVRNHHINDRDQTTTRQLLGLVRECTGRNGCDQKDKDTPAFLVVEEVIRPSPCPWMLLKGA